MEEARGMLEEALNSITDRADTYYDGPA